VASPRSPAAFGATEEAVCSAPLRATTATTATGTDRTAVIPKEAVREILEHHAWAAEFNATEGGSRTSSRTDGPGRA
jgi:hypothetical protein